MVKNSSGKTSAPSRIRFVMVEAELADGDIGQITHAIQNALRGPAASPAKRLTTATAANGDVPEPEIELQTEHLEDNEVIPATHAPRARGPRRPSPSPNIVNVDMKADVSLESFAQGKDAKSQHKKYLIAAAWLKEHRGIDGVTADHIYTCFRSMNWSTNIRDFSQPLRALKAEKYFSKNDENEYEINHIGLDYVKRLGGYNGAD